MILSRIKLFARNAEQPISVQPLIKFRPRIAVFSRNASAIEKDIRAVRKYIDGKIGIEFVPICDIPDKGEHIWRNTRRHCLYFFNTASKFDVIIIGASMCLFPCEWSYALIAYALEQVHPDGCLLMGGVGMHRSKRGTLGGEDLEALGLKQIQALSKEVLKIPALDFNYQPASVLKWYLDNTAPLVAEYAALRYAGDSIGSEFMDPPFGESLDMGIREQSYRLGGIRYKAPIMRFIIKEELKATHPITHVDLGGGYGLLSAELLLDPQLAVNASQTGDYSSREHAFFNRLKQGISSTAANKLSFWFGSSQDYSFSFNPDVVSFIGSLLYVPESLRRPTLDCVWEHLAPGGLLVIHENIKNPSYTTDYDKMFTVDDLDSLLSHYGEITRYSSVALKHLSQVESGASTVFRVVRKNEV